MQIRNVNAGPVQTKCPHGALPNSCPACSSMGGGGGGGGGTSKAKPSGLMGWNEAYALWSAIQREQGREKLYQKGISDAVFLRNKEANRPPVNPSPAQVLFQRLTQPVLGFIRNIAAFMGIQRASEGQMAGKANPVLNNEPRNAAQVHGEAGLKLVLNKLASQLGEVQQFLEEQIHHYSEMLKSVFAEINWRQRMLNVFAASERLLQRLNPKELFKSVLSWFGLKEEPQKEENLFQTKQIPL